MSFLTWVERGLRLVWQWHFHIPEPVYWLVLLLVAPGVALIGVFAGDPWVVGGGAVATAVGVQGVARWRFHRRRARGALVVPLFQALDSRQAKQVQGMVMTALLDHLSDREAELAHSVPAVVGPAQRAFAVRLRRRLRAYFLVQGELRERADGGLSVYARVLQPLEPEVLHIDPHTRDVTPMKVSWRHLFQRLSPQEEVREVEYPLEFAEELEALVRGVAGQFAALLEDYSRAERLLREAIDVRADSRSHALDQLRVDLALAMAAQDRHEEAIEDLRRRADEDDASPELLRSLYRLLGTDPDGTWRTRLSPEGRHEAVSLLRRAASHHGDPRRDMTIYNLANVLATGGPEDEQEAKQLIEDLLRSGGHYRGAWYVQLSRGAVSWAELLGVQQAGDEEAVRAKAKEAAYWYSRAARSRPRVRLFWREGARLWLLRQFPPAPILHANARDGHDMAGHRLRTLWHEWRFQRLRRSLLKRGDKQLRGARFVDAYASFDWAIVGRADHLETLARTCKAIALRQLGEDEEAEQEWQTARDADPHAILMRATVANDRRGYPLPRGLPGNEPSDPDGATKLFVKRGGLSTD